MQKEISKTPKKAAPKKAAEGPQTDTKSVKATAPKKAAAKKEAVKKEAAPKKETANKATTKATQVLINFQLAYGTRFGQNIYLSGNVPQLGNNHDANALPLRYIDAAHWGTEVKINTKDLSKDGLKYYYIIEHEDGSTEKSAPYYLFANDLTKIVHVSDAWNYAGFEQNAFSTKVFEVLQDKIAAESKKSNTKKGSHKFAVNAPALPAHYGIFLLGNCKGLGNWDAENIILLSPDEQSGTWATRVSIVVDDEAIEYKYGIYDLVENAIVAFEEGSNRTLTVTDTPATLIIINDGFLRSNN